LAHLHFLFSDLPLICPKLIELESLNLVCWQAFAGTMATYKVIKQQKLMLKSSIKVVRAQNDTTKTANITATIFDRTQRRFAN